MNSRPRSLREILAASESYLQDKGRDSPKLCAQLILCQALGLSRIDLFLDLDRLLSEEELAKVRPLLARRGKGEPMAYIAGSREFYGLDFTCAQAALIPRPETELLIELCEKRYPLDSELYFADLGTGCGAICVSLLARYPQARGLGLEISAPALELTRENAAKHRVEERLELLLEDYAELSARPQSFDLILANPPYVSASEYACLSPEVREFEPALALTPGQSGLEAYERIAPLAFAALKTGGALLLEIGCGQAASVLKIVETAGFADCRAHKDLAGLNRAIEARKP